MKRTSGEWKRQAAERARPITIHYYPDARESGPALTRGYSADANRARGRAYEKVGVELYNKAVIVDERSGLEVAVLRRNSRDGSITVKDSKWDKLL